jgi:opacity protein-like surface antigen
MMIKFRNLAVFLALGMFAFSGVLSAEELDKGASEALGYVGGLSGGGGTTFGAGYARVVNSRLLVIGEVGYMTLGGGYGAYQNILGGSSVDASGIEFGANAHYLFPLKSNSKFTPYALGGLGVIHTSVSVNVNVSGQSFGGTGGNTNVGLNIGGGARWQAGKNWGVRPELKFFLSSNTLTRGSIGLYYQFGK